VKKILTAKISNQFGFMVICILGVVFAITSMVCWLIGSQNVPPKFVLNPNDLGVIRAVDQPWWRRYGDLVHGRKYMMLTFDDGPADRETNETILNVLKKHHAHAVFFTVCKNAMNAEGAENLKAVVAAGNILGNHTLTHSRLSEMTPDAVEREVVDCQKVLTDITGREVKLFRPPWGQHSSVLVDILKKHQLKEVLWLANSGDTWLHAPDKINALTVSEVSDNCIVLMHSNAVEARALDRSLTLLEEQGYEFVLAEE